VALSEKGKEQAEQAGKRLKELVGGEGMSFFVSPFKRCRQTVQLILKSFPNEKQYAVKEDPRIREQEWGNLQSEESKEEQMRQRGMVGRFFFRFPQGESGADVFDRVSGFLDSMFRYFDRGVCPSNVVIVTHGLLIRLFLMRYYYWSVEKFESVKNFDNCEFVIMEKASERGRGLYNLVTPLTYEDEKNLE